MILRQQLSKGRRGQPHLLLIHITKWQCPVPLLVSLQSIHSETTAERCLRTREMYVPLSHPPGDAQCGFGQAKAVI